MVTEKSPSIKVEDGLKNKLEGLKEHPNQSYSEVVDGLVVLNQNKSLSEFWAEVKEKTKKLIEEEKEKTKSH